MASLFEAYITNLGKYNEGELVGEALKFPTTTEEVQGLLKRIGVDGVRYEEFFITSFDGDVLGLYDYLTEYENLDELFLRLTDALDFPSPGYHNIEHNSCELSQILKENSLLRIKYSRISPVHLHYTHHPFRPPISALVFWPGLYLVNVCKASDNTINYISLYIRCSIKLFNSFFLSSATVTAAKLSIARV